VHALFESVEAAGAVERMPPARAPGPVMVEHDAEARDRSGGVVRSMGIGQRFAVGAAVGLWLGDMAVLAHERVSVGWTRWLTAAGASLFVAMTTALVVGAVGGIVFVPLATTAGEVLRPWWRRLHAGDTGLRRAFAAQLLGALGLAAAAAWVSYRIALSTELGFTGPRLMAVALTLSHFIFAAALALTWPWSVRLARAFVDGASRAPGARWVFDRPWRLPAALAGLILAAGSVLVFAHREELALLPWPKLIAAPGALLGLAAAAWAVPAATRVRPSWGRFVTRAAFALEVVALCAGAAAAARLHPESTTARQLAFDRALSGRLGYAAWTSAFDFDGDGQLGMLGGGDCAPFDPRRHAGAVDIPGNGIDEDCDGTDLLPLTIGPRPRMRVGQDRLPSRPSIVLVTIDALAAPRLVALGGAPAGRAPLMPNLDGLADRGMLFAHCFSQGPSTRLSFPSMFTSRWDSQLDHLFAPIHPYSLASSDRQLQDMLDDAGYGTMAVIPDAYFGAARWSSMTRGFQHVDASAIPAGKHNAPQVTEAALRALASAGRDAPVYLWVHYYDAHSPYGLPPGAPPVEPRSDERLYEAELSYIDKALGPLIAAVEARPEPTYLIVTADHATVFHPDPSTRHGHYGYDLYSATLHVPLILRGPGIPPGRVDGLVSTMDIVPTIADLLRLSSASFEGTSLLPEALAAKGDPNRVLFHEYYLPERGFRGQDPLEIVSVRNARYNLVLDRTRGMYELYDWTADYFERRDLYEDQARSPDVLRLRSLLGSFVLRYHNRWQGAGSGERR
jgi:choline-sulfatase